MGKFLYNQVQLQLSTIKSCPPARICMFFETFPGMVTSPVPVLYNPVCEIHNSQSNTPFTPTWGHFLSSCLPGKRNQHPPCCSILHSILWITRRLILSLLFSSSLIILVLQTFHLLCHSECGRDTFFRFSDIQGKYGTEEGVHLKKKTHFNRKIK